MRRRRFPGLRCRLLLLILALASPAAASGQGYFPPDAYLEPMLRYLVEDGATVGIVLALRDSDSSSRILLYGSGGEGARALGAESVFEIGSITKTFTGVLLADMVARGEVSLRDPASRYLPAHVRMPSWGERGITLLDLATHRSGLPQMPDNGDSSSPGDRSAGYGVEDLYEFLSGHELRRAPGEEAEYSNVGFGLLGHLLERASGQSYEDLVKERILEPLGMHMTGVTPSGELAAWHTKGHTRSGGEAPRFNALTLVGAGGLRSTPADMLRYLEANIGTPTSDIEHAMRAAQEMRSPFGEGGIGLGWQSVDHDGRTLITHGGSTAGYGARIAFDPERGLGVVRLANTTDFRDDFELDLLREGAGPSIPEVHVERRVLRDYVGAYEFSDVRMLVRLEEEGNLTLQTPPNVRFPMYSASDSAFFLKRKPLQIFFTRDDDGAVTGLEVSMQGRRFEVPKVSDETPDPAVAAGNAAAIGPPPGGVAPYTGRYTIRIGERDLPVRIYTEDGTLMVEQGASSRLIRVGEHEFAVEIDPDIRLKFGIRNGRAETITLHRGGRATEGTRTGDDR